MKKRYWVGRKGTKYEVVKLDPYEKHLLREKNLKMLREQRLMKETVQYADYQPVEDDDGSRTCPRADEGT